MQKRMFLVLLTILMVLTSCASGTAHVHVKKDGSMDLELDLTLPEETQLPLQGEIEQRMEKQLKQQGFTFEKINQTEGLRYRAEKNLNTEEASTSHATNELFTLTTEEHFWQTIYTVDAEINMLETYGGILETVNSTLPFDIIQRVDDQLDLQFKVTLPGDIVRNSNATEREGNTLIWDIALADSNRISFSVAAPKLTRIMVTVGLGLLLVMGIGIFIWRRRKR
ncbi:hypothetical protein ACFFGV_13705 [Pontibacillus salicampi]|uniref:DUF3153 domain-containing protein n=1 Tax=Pontibacillus salicampi TaxID=1449801 RepID=A0ABV6LQQ2_9BACI